MWKSVQILNVFNTLTLKRIFLKTKTLFRKLENRFLVESTKIENASFPYKMDLSQRTEFCQGLLYFFENFGSV